MELDDLKNIWLKEKEELESKIVLNEKLLKELAFDKTVSSFDKLINTAILGRNLALVYMVISIFLGAKVFFDFQYSIPVFIGAGAMLFSFFQHLSLKKPDYNKMNSIELQKTICQFRIHSMKYSKYDISIVSFWLITLIPIYCKYILKLDYSFLSILAIDVAFIGLVYFLSKNIYEKWDNELKENEEQLNKIIDFENN